MTIEELLVKEGRWADSRGPRTGKGCKGFSVTWEMPVYGYVGSGEYHSGSMRDMTKECKLTTVPCTDDEKGVCV